MKGLQEQITKGISKLDKDGDGNLSLEEVEEAGREAWQRIYKCYVPIRDFLTKYKWTANAVSGYTAAFYGGNFTHVFLCATAFRSSEGQAVLKNFRELVEITNESKTKFVEKVGKNGVLVSTGSATSMQNVVDGSSLLDAAKNVLKAGAGVPETSPSDNSQLTKTTRQQSNVGVPPSTVLAALSCIDPTRLMNCVQSLYSGFLVALCAAMNENAAKFGLGLAMGERISTFLLGIADKFIQKAEDKMRQKFETENPSATEEQKKLALENLQPTWEWSKLGLKTICTSLGVFISWRLKDAAAVWAACHWGGIKCAIAVFQILDQKDVALQEMVGLAIAWYGFAFHLRHLNRPSMPFFLSLPLGPLSLLETLLRGLTMSNTAGS